MTVRIVDNKAEVATESVTTFTHADLKARIENLTGERLRLFASISAQTEALARVDIDLDAAEKLLADAEALGLRSAAQAERIEGR